jgi:hypothetical protein
MRFWFNQILRPRIEHGNHYATKANPVLYGDFVVLSIGIVPLYIGIMALNSVILVLYIVIVIGNVGIIYW